MTKEEKRQVIKDLREWKNCLTVKDDTCNFCSKKRICNILKLLKRNPKLIEYYTGELNEISKI